MQELYNNWSHWNIWDSYQAKKYSLPNDYNAENDSLKALKIPSRDTKEEESD